MAMSASWSTTMVQSEITATDWVGIKYGGDICAVYMMTFMCDPLKRLYITVYMGLQGFFNDFLNVFFCHQCVNRLLYKLRNET